jgi:hypothetical protein
MTRPGKLEISVQNINKTEHKAIGKLVKDLQGKTSHIVQCGGQNEEFFQAYQQDATLYDIRYYCQCSTCFRRFLRPSSGDQNCTHSIWYVPGLLAATASGSSKQA